RRWARSTFPDPGAPRAATMAAGAGSSPGRAPRRRTAREAVDALATDLELRDLDARDVPIRPRSACPPALGSTAAARDADERGKHRERKGTHEQGQDSAKKALS